MNSVYAAPVLLGAYPDSIGLTYAAVCTCAGGGEFWRTHFVVRGHGEAS